MNIDLRDYFAGQALVSCLKRYIDDNKAVRISYEIADKMLAERKKSEDKDKEENPDAPNTKKTTE